MLHKAENRHTVSHEQYFLTTRFLDQFEKTNTLLYVIIMSRTSFRVNLHSIVCQNVKELPARSRRYIWNLSNSNEIRTHNHLVRKRTLNHLAQLANFLVKIRYYLLAFKYKTSYLFRYQNIS